MDINLFDFDLPEKLIAQTPEKVRDHSRLLVVNKATQTTEDKHFYDILDYLVPGDVLVRNDTKVIPARLLGVKEDTHAHVEVNSSKPSARNKISKIFILCYNDNYIEVMA